MDKCEFLKNDNTCKMFQCDCKSISDCHYKLTKQNEQLKKENTNILQIIEIIRTEAKKQHKTLKSVAEYAGMKSTYINKFLGGGCGLPSVEKLQKIGEFLNIDLIQYIETKESLKAENINLKLENASLKETIKKYQKMTFIYENFEELQRLKTFIDGNKGILKKIDKMY